MDPLVGLFGPCSDDAEIPEMPEVLPPEIEEGNVEYKLKLVDPSESRFEHLVTQLKWRLQEGEGEAIYEIGVEDNGLLAGLRDQELEASLNTLGRMAERLGASISVIREKTVKAGEDHRRVVEVLVRKVPDNQQFIDLRLAVLGNVDAGKSTLLGVLTQGELDNGWGRARLNLFRHLHEIQTGRTSSISHEILGFNSRGEVVNYSEARNAEEICENSTKLITLIDLCGHHKYLKTTIFGLTGYSPDFAMLVVSANTGIVGTTKEHLGFALALGVPIFVVVSKIDMCRKAQVERTVKQLEKILKGPGCKKVPFRVESEDDAVTAAATFHTERVPILLKMAESREEFLKSMGITRSQENASTSDVCLAKASSLQEVRPLTTSDIQGSGPLTTPKSETGLGPSGLTKGVKGKNESVLFNSDEYESICPIFAVSSVSGKNLELLTKFLNVLPPLHSVKEREQFMQQLAEHQIDEVYDIQGVGLVAGGTVLRGTIKEGDRLLLGPGEDGRFQPVTVSTIQRNRLASRLVSAGQSCSLSLGNNPMPVRKGMVLVSPELNPQACLEFEADIYVLFHTNYICKGFQTVIHVGNVRQTAIITRTSKGALHTNEKAVVVFSFINRPEFIRVGSRLLFREGRTKGMGEITKIFPFDPSVPR